MKNRRKSIVGILAVTMMMAMVHVFPVFAASWQQDGKGWRWVKNDGSYPANCWQWLDGDRDGIAYCYYFDESGHMLASTTTPDGYQVDARGRWYENNRIKSMSRSSETAVIVPDGKWQRGNGANANRWWWRNADGTYPANCWQWLDENEDGIAECYYFDADGWLLSSAETPDGYHVDEAGRWLGKKGVKARKANQKEDIAKEQSSASDKKEYVYQKGAERANDFEYANLRKMTTDQWEETKGAIEKFKQEYIKEGMSDLEKEIMIIEWLVGNCRYEIGENWSRSTAYSCIVLGKAQCSGYADAFLQTAKLCGLDVRYVYSETHAWNLVKLDGDWYHVDVTWEDPVGQNEYGFGNLRNTYINLTDDQIRTVGSHDTWELTSISASGTKYGPAVVAECLAKESRQ